MGASRPSDWSVFRGGPPYVVALWGSCGDPIPGDPEVVSQCAASYRDTADAIGEIGGDLLRRIDLESRGASIQQIIDDIKDVSNEMQKAKSRFQGVGDALGPYADALEDAQAISLVAYDEAHTAKGDSQKAGQSAASFSAAYERVARQMNSLDWQYRCSTDPEKREELRIEYNRLKSTAAQHQGDYQAARNREASANASLEAARRKLRDAMDARDKAADTAVARLEYVSEHSPLKDSFWDKICAVVDAVVSAVRYVIDNIIKPIVKFLADFAIVLVGVVVAVLAVIALVKLWELTLVASVLFLVVKALLPDNSIEHLPKTNYGLDVPQGLTAKEEDDYKAYQMTLFMHDSYDEDDLDAYGNPKVRALPEGFHRLSNAELSAMNIDPALLSDSWGMHAEVYQKKDGTLVVAFAGTQLANGPTDAVTDVVGAFETTPADRTAIALALAVKQASGGKPLTFVGHSLGGREASLAAIATDSPAVTLNAAGPSVMAQQEAALHRSIDTPSIINQSRNNVVSMESSSDPLTVWENRVFGVPDSFGQRYNVSEGGHGDKEVLGELYDELPDNVKSTVKGPKDWQ